MSQGDAPTENRCALCARQGVSLTRHHLIPRALHGRKRFRKRFSRDEMKGDILMICRPCHNHIHRVLSEREMAEHYHTREALLAQPEIAEFARWLSARPPGFKPKSPIKRQR
ncbi:hypothetical protein [Kushneria sp. TE3]|uniref:hypothetical protein n=1 Tax=Kushneria sp. TE3 TaxID=3449832 RepID=UPI003F687EB0